MTPDRAPTVRELLTFYLEAGVDCALMDEPANRLSDDDAVVVREAAQPSARIAAAPLAPRVQVPMPPTRGDIAPAPEVAVQSAREAARTAPSLAVDFSAQPSKFSSSVRNTASDGAVRAASRAD
jgi:hypothetical protein